MFKYELNMLYIPYKSEKTDPSIHWAIWGIGYAIPFLMLGEMACYVKHVVLIPWFLDINSTMA